MYTEREKERERERARDIFSGQISLSDILVLRRNCLRKKNIIIN
jgi:hypothetical protein